MPRNGTVIGLGRALGDVDHVVQDPVLALGALAVGLAQPTPGAQAFGQVTAQRTTGLHVQGLVNGLGGHPHLRVVGVVISKSASDLFGRVLLLQVLLDPHPKDHVRDLLGRLARS